MRVIRFEEMEFVAAGHEDPRDPGVWKKVLFQKDNLQTGRVQMINWSLLPIGKQFAAHYHEDMQEVFVVLSGEARLIVDREAVVLRKGDAVLIDAREVHVMVNDGTQDVEYLALGITREEGGRTVLVDESTDSNASPPVAL